MHSAESAHNHILTDDESLIEQVERALARSAPLSSRLEQAAEALGTHLAATRVMIYGNSDHDDAAVRVRVAWSADGRSESSEWMSAIPLLTRRPRARELVVSAPRGTHCPGDCETSLADCALRGACSTLLEPLELGGDVYGSLAVHGITGRPWKDHERGLARQVARRIALEIARHRQELADRELDAERSSVAMTALHQLATPVTVLGCVIDELAMRPDGTSERIDDLLEIARKEWQRLRRLCDDIAVLVQDDVSRSSSHCDVVRQVAASVEAARCEHPDATISITVVGEIPNARCSAHSLNRMLGELIENSHRYCPNPVRIDLMVSCEPEGVVIRLRDDGPGISETQADMLGSAFTRLDPGMLHSPGGSGLGLAIVGQLARQAGGSISLSPRSDRPGTQVALVLAPAGEPSSRDRA